MFAAADSTETAQRIAADNTLQSNVDDEAEARAAADSTETARMLRTLLCRATSMMKLTPVLPPTQLRLPSALPQTTHCRVISRTKLKPVPMPIQLKQAQRIAADGALEDMIEANDSDISSLQDGLQSEILARGFGDAYQMPSMQIRH